MAIHIKSHSRETWRRCRWTKVGRFQIRAPVVAAFIAVSIARYEEARDKPIITDQQLIFILWVCCAAPTPQSSQDTSITPRRYKSGTALVSEEGFISGCFVHEQDLTKLQTKRKGFSILILYMTDLSRKTRSTTWTIIICSADFIWIDTWDRNTLCSMITVS